MPRETKAPNAVGRPGLFPVSSERLDHEEAVERDRRREGRQIGRT